jgi:hypothetical protein
VPKDGYRQGGGTHQSFGLVSQIDTPYMSRTHNRHGRCAPRNGPCCDGQEVMNLETLPDAAFVDRDTKICRDAAERLREDGNRGGVVIAIGVASPFDRRHTTFYPIGADGRQLDAKVTVTAAQKPPADLIQREWPSPQGFWSRDHLDSVTAPGA